MLFTCEAEKLKKKFMKEREERKSKRMREMNKKLFSFLAFLSIPFQNGTMLFTCGKNYEIWNIS